MAKAIEDKKNRIRIDMLGASGLAGVRDIDDQFDILESLIREDEREQAGIDKTIAVQNAMTYIRNKVIDECITEVGLSYLPSNSDFGPEDMIELFQKLVVLKDKQE